MSGFGTYILLLLLVDLLCVASPPHVEPKPKSPVVSKLRCLQPEMDVSYSAVIGVSLCTLLCST